MSTTVSIEVFSLFKNSKARPILKLTFSGLSFVSETVKAFFSWTSFILYGDSSMFLKLLIDLKYDLVFVNVLSVEAKSFIIFYACLGS